MDSETEEPWHMSDGECHVSLTHDHLNAQDIINKVRSPAAGAIVLFAGMRDTPRSWLI